MGLSSLEDVNKYIRIGIFNREFHKIRDRFIMLFVTWSWFEIILGSDRGK